MIAERVLEEHGMDGVDGMDEYGQGEPLESEFFPTVDVNAIVIDSRKPNGKRIHFFYLPTLSFFDRFQIKH